MYRKAMLVALLGSVLLSPSWAKSASRSSRDLIVVEPKSLPELARSQAQAMMLYQLGNGQKFLYLEQQQLARIVILDVTDPGHIEIVGCSALDASVPFDFSNPVGDSAIFIHFRKNLGSAVLDLHKPKAPSLRTADVLKQAMRMEALGSTQFTIVDQPAPEHIVAADDYQVIDASDPRSPNLLATIRLVQQKIENRDTGTVFLLGADGLTLLRHPHLEEEYRALNFGN
jgi:hypothetical protein